MNELKKLRAECGMSQADVAAAVGVSQPFIAAVEAGKKNIPLDLALRLSHALGVDPATLIPSNQAERRKLFLDLLSALDVNDLMTSRQGRSYLLRLVRTMLEAGDVSFAESIIAAANEAARSDAPILQHLPLKHRNRKEVPLERTHKPHGAKRRHKAERLALKAERSSE